MGWIARLFGGPGGQRKIGSPLDLVIYAAGLASSSKPIDPTLDKVRAITAQMHPGESLPAAVEAPLFQAYLEIEDYLTTREPMRTFTKDELRRRLQEGLLMRLEQFETAAK